MTIDNLKSPDLAAPSLASASRAATARGPDLSDVLRLDDLHISVHDGAALAVRGISLSIRAGEIVGLVGESGSGKTLTCRAALGVLPPGVTIEQGTLSNPFLPARPGVPDRRPRGVCADGPGRRGHRGRAADPAGGPGARRHPGPAGR